MKYKAVIFDLDGTLIDSMQIWRQVDTEFLGSRGIGVPSDLFEHLPMGNSFVQTAQYFKDRFGLKDSVDSIMQEWTQMVTHHYETDIPLKDEAREFIESLVEQKIKVGLGTSNSHFLAQKVLSRNGIWQYFESVVTGEQVKLGKPFPDIYLKAAKELEITPNDCLVIEDTLSGVRAGKAAGMDVFAIFDQDSIEHHEIIKTEADGFYHSFAQIRSIL